MSTGIYNAGEIVQPTRGNTSNSNPDDTAININTTTFYDIKRILDERRASMLLGQGIEIKSDDNRFQELFHKIDKINYLDDLFLTYLQLATAHGVVYTTIGRNEAGDWVLDFADPYWINIVKDVNLNVWGGRIRKIKFVGLTPYYIDEFYKADGSVKRYFYIHLDQIQAVDWYDDEKVPEEFKLPETEQFPFCPLFKYVNKAKRNLQKANNYEEMAEDYAVRHIPLNINLILQQIYKHVLMSKDRIIGNVSQQWITDMLNESKSGLTAFLGDLIVSTDESPNTQQKVELQEARPKIKEYMEGVVSLLNEYMRGRNMSPIDDSTAQQTEAETLFTKSLDIESCKIIKKRFTEFLSLMLDKIFIAEGLMSGDEKERPYALELKENLVMNEIQLTSNLIEQINNNLISRIEAISKLRGISEDKAKEIYEQIVKQAEEDELALQNQLLNQQGQQEQSPPLINEDNNGNT